MKLRIGAATLNQTPLDWENNYRNIRHSIAEAKSEGVDLLVLPELSITSYGCQDMFLAPWLSEMALEYLLKILPETEKLAVCIGLPFWWEGQLFNCMAFLENGEIKGLSAKQNLPGDGVYYEPRWFNPWPSKKKVDIDLFGKNIPFGDIIYSYKGLKLAFEICEDAWRELRPALNYVTEGVDIILNPSASHFEFQKYAFRENLMKRSSKQFSCVYIYANQSGNEAGRLIYEGDIIIASHGNILKRNRYLSFRTVKLIHCDLDFEKNNPIPINEYEYPGIYEEFTQAASLALFDYLRKSGSRGYTLSLSGGADSSCCAILVSEMVKRGIKELGEEEFLERIGHSGFLGKTEKELVGAILNCAYQATKNSSSVTKKAAKMVSEEIGANYSEWEIDEEIEIATRKIEKSIGRKLSWSKDDLSLQNIQSRMRSPLIWLLANSSDHLLLTTSNRSEGDVGYTTMDGDTSGGLAPLADLDKVFIRNWLRWAEKELGYHSLQFVNSQDPTAELRPLATDQTDEKDLMPYPILLEIEKRAIASRMSPLQVYNSMEAEGFAEKIELKKYITKFFKAWARNQWKRERLAPSFHFDHFNIDPKTWMRFPILNGSFDEELKRLNN